MNPFRLRETDLFATSGQISLAILVLVSLSDSAVADQTDILRVPAFSAYVEPVSAPLRVGDDGITGWTNREHKINWYGRINHAGVMTASVETAANGSNVCEYSLTVSCVADGRTVKRLTGTCSALQPTVKFGRIEVGQPGYYRFQLAALRNLGTGITEIPVPFSTIQSLNLSGEAIRGAQFNLTKRRNAASVHLWYPVDKGEQVQAFYNEVTVETEPLWSYYMACGFHRGYFGIQVNSPTERRIIFSVWDSGNEAVDRRKVDEENQVKLLDHGEDVVAHGFGNEGTGGHSHLVYPWKKGETYRFLITAQPDGKHTIFAGWFFFPEKNQWGLIAKFRAPKDGGYLRGLYSFSENFVGRNGHLLRKAAFGNQWIATPGGEWHELVNARFTHDGHGKEHRKDYSTGVENGRFVLSHGGFLETRSNYGQTLERAAGSNPPSDVNLKLLLSSKRDESKTTQADSASSKPGRPYSIPYIDLDSQKHRQVVIDREAGQYLGHPTTVLLEDNKTMLCVYPKGHGRGGIVYKRSYDAGKTWTDRLKTPANWATSREVPTLHRVIAPDGRKRIIMFSGLYPCRMAVTEDDGLTWSELKPVGEWGGIVTMGCVESLRTGPGHYMAMFHDDGRFFASKANVASPKVFTLFKTLSLDGGLTWSFPEVVDRSSELHICEPGIIRSPDGKQLAVLLRENSRRQNSQIIFSNDEGMTWTKPRPMPASLNGDRHTGKYASDGRLLISFRSRSPRGSQLPPHDGDWIAWVGTYDDLASGREGQCVVRFKDNHKGADCAYPGVEILPDDTFIVTTYGHWAAGEAPYILSVRLKLAELDRIRLSELTQP